MMAMCDPDARLIVVRTSCGLDHSRSVLFLLSSYYGETVTFQSTPF